MVAVPPMLIGSGQLEIPLRLFGLSPLKLLNQWCSLGCAIELAQDRAQGAHSEVCSRRPHGTLGVMKSFLVVLLMIMSERHKICEATRLRIVGVEA